jgi:hypothetical protein
MKNPGARNQAETIPSQRFLRFTTSIAIRIVYTRKIALCNGSARQEQYRKNHEKQFYRWPLVFSRLQIQTVFLYAFKRI